MTVNVYIERFHRGRGEREGDHSQFDSYEAAFGYARRMKVDYKFRVWIDGEERRLKDFYPEYRGY